MDRSQVVASPLLRLVRAAILLFLVVAPEIPAHSQNAAKKQPIPAAEAQAKAEKLVKELFKDDFAKKKPADMVALSAKLLEQATETKDDLAARFVLYREARDLAAQAGDATQALKIVNDIASEFAVNAPIMKAESLAVVASVTIAPADAKALVETTLQVVEEAVADDNFEAADKLLKVASAAATKAKSIPLVSSVQSRAKDVESLQKEFEAVKLAMVKLGKNPKDAEANSVAGRYLCLMKGDWEKGLPMLAMGGDAKLKASTAKDLAEPKEAAAQVEIGDAWWDLAEAEKGLAKSNLQKRALHWYRLALPNLAGLNKTRVEKRVALFPSVEPFAILEGAWTIKYGNGATRNYVIDPQGRVAWSTATSIAQGRLAAMNGQVLLDLGDKTLERVRISGGKLLVEQFNPATLYPAGKPSAEGTGVKTHSVVSREPRTKNAYSAYEGVWLIKYSNAACRVYLIDHKGAVAFPSENLKGQLATKKNEVLLDFADGRIERINLADGKLVVEHFAPASNYPNKKPDNATGTKLE